MVSVYDNGDLETNTGLQARAGSGPWYGWASYEDPEYGILGQKMGPLELPGIGFGVRPSFGEWFTFVFEAGYYEPSLSPKASIRDEVVEQYLNNAHFDAGGYRTFQHESYEIEGSVGARFGVAFEREIGSATVSVEATQRFLSLPQKWDAWNGTEQPTEDCGVDKTCWWQMRDNLDLNAYQIGISVRWEF